MEPRPNIVASCGRAPTEHIPPARSPGNTRHALFRLLGKQANGFSASPPRLEAAPAYIYPFFSSLPFVRAPFTLPSALGVVSAPAAVSVVSFARGLLARPPRRRRTQPPLPPSRLPFRDASTRARASSAAGRLVREPLQLFQCFSPLRGGVVVTVAAFVAPLAVVLFLLFLLCFSSVFAAVVIGLAVPAVIVAVGIPRVRGEILVRLSGRVWASIGRGGGWRLRNGAVFYGRS